MAQLEEMFVLPEIRRPPGLPPHLRGLATMRGSTLRAVDLRICLGLESASTELESVLALCADREQDHREWLTELEASARENRPFQLERDPRKCKLGRWYYSLKPEDAVLRSELATVEQAHAATHALAGQVEALTANGRQQEALGLIERARQGLLEELGRRFDQVRRALRAQQHEIGVKTAVHGQRTVLIVDRAEAVADLERISDADDPLVSGEMRADLVCRMARWSGASAPVMLLDLERIVAL